MVAAQVRCKNVEDNIVKIEADRARLEAEVQSLRIQLQACREAGRAALDWQGQVEALVRGGATVLAPLVKTIGSSVGSLR